jgi:hypothetical protein
MIRKTLTTLFLEILVFSTFTTEGLVNIALSPVWNCFGSFCGHYITKREQKPITMYVESEISGYSTPDSDTVVIYPNKAVEIHQNPRLNTEAIDQLNSKCLDIYNQLLLNSKREGDDLILKESKEILI